MIGRTARVTGWMLGGSAGLAALYWLLLNTPETSTLALAASAALLLALLALSALVVNVAVLLSRGSPFGEAFRRGIRGAPWFVAMLVPLAAIWWVITAVDSWVSNHAGEINAWFIARFGWADVSRLFLAETWLARWLGWVVAPLAGLSLLAAWLDYGGAGVRRDAWLVRAWHWRTLILATLVFVLFIVLPWQITQWRPALPATWVEPAVAALRLSVVAILWSAGAALLIMLSSARGTTGSERPATPEP
jgi:hypothetical protein